MNDGSALSPSRQSSPYSPRDCFTYRLFTREVCQIMVPAVLCITPTTLHLSLIMSCTDFKELLFLLQLPSFRTRGLCTCCPLHPPTSQQHSFCRSSCCAPTSKKFSFCFTYPLFTREDCVPSVLCIIPPLSNTPFAAHLLMHQLQQIFLSA